MSTILVVDDMAICREPIAEALQAHSYRVVCAAGGAEALSILREDPPDLVLLDVNMPKPDGWDVLSTMRKNPEMRSTPVILLTDRRAKEDVVQAARHGVQGYLLKSQFSLDELLGRVGACLGGRSVLAAQVSKSEQTGSAQWRAQKTESMEEYPSSPQERKASPPPNRVADSRISPTPGPAGTLDSARSLDDLTAIITKSELTTLVNEGLDLRPLGTTVHNVIAVTGSTGCCADDVARAIASDQALCIRILKLANSSAYSRGHLVNSVKEAVGRIGVQEVRSLVMTLGVFEQFEGASAKYVDVRLFWEHSFACGLAAAAIAKACQSKNVKNCFLWGMVHDIGRLILLEHVSDKYANVWKAAERLNLPLESVEAKIMLLDHCDILELALEHWKFPRDFITPVVNHHHSIQTIKGLGPAHREVAAIVALANRLAHALLLGSSGNEVIYPLDDFVEMLGLPPSEIAGLVEKIADETNELKITILSRTTEDNWPDSADQVRQRLSKPLRPLCVSAAPDVDAYRMFCERIAHWDGEERPNVGIIYLRNAAELSALATVFDREERKRGLTNLPVIVIHDKGKVDAGFAWLRARRHELLKAPVPIKRFLAAALSSPSPAAPPDHGRTTQHQPHDAL